MCVCLSTCVRVTALWQRTLYDKRQQQTSEILPMLAQLGRYCFLVFAAKAIRLYCSIPPHAYLCISISIYKQAIALVRSFARTNANLRGRIDAKPGRTWILFGFFSLLEHIGHKMLMVFLERWVCLIVYCLANSGLPHTSNKGIQNKLVHNKPGLGITQMKWRAANERRLCRWIWTLADVL